MQNVSKIKTKRLDVAFVVLFEEQSSDSGGDAAEGLKTSSLMRDSGFRPVLTLSGNFLYNLFTQ